MTSSVMRGPGALKSRIDLPVNSTVNDAPTATLTSSPLRRLSRVTSFTSVIRIQHPAGPNRASTMQRPVVYTCPAFVFSPQ
jgi:hypothetical protein